MGEWKITPQFTAKGPESLREREHAATIEPGDGKRPGYLTIDVYPDRLPKYPARHFGAWQFSFDDIGDATQLTVALDPRGVTVSVAGKALTPVKVIQGPLKEDGLYIAYLVLAEKDTYAKLSQAQYYRHLSFSGADINPAEHWPESSRRNLRTIQPEYWMMKKLYEAVGKFAAELPAGSSVLDYGGGNSPYYPCFVSRGIKYSNADVLDGQFVNIVCKPGENLPLADNSCDAILCTHVLEHTKDPLTTFAEIRRILKPGGTIFFAAPFAWENHHQPFDFWRFGRDMIEQMFAPFKDVKIVADSNAAQALTMLRNCHYYRAVKNCFLRDTLIRWGNFKYKLLADCNADPNMIGNFIVTATK